MENKEVIATNIQYYLDRAGKSRQQLGDDLGVPYTTVCGWLQAENYPRINKIEKLANYFGVSKADLIESRTQNDRLYEKIMKLPEDKRELIEALIDKMNG